MMRKIVQTIGARWIFLSLVIMLYAILAIIDPGKALTGLKGFLTLLKNILPALAIVFSLLFILNLTVDTKLVMRFLGRKSGIRGWIISIIAGIISMGPIYLWYPLMSELKEKGMRNGLIATFLYNRSIKIPLISVMIVYFGSELVVVLLLLTILFSICNGLLIELIGPSTLHQVTAEPKNDPHLEEYNDDSRSGSEKNGNG